MASFFPDIFLFISPREYDGVPSFIFVLPPSSLLFTAWPSHHAFCICSALFFLDFVATQLISLEGNNVMDTGCDLDKHGWKRQFTVR